jgi:hypothetical protein
MNSCFRSNSLLANTALILLCNFGWIFVDSCGFRKLLRRQAHCHRIPELILSRIPKSHERPATKYQFSEIERHIELLDKRGCWRWRGRGRRSLCTLGKKSKETNKMLFVRQKPVHRTVRNRRVPTVKRCTGMNQV